MMPITVRRNTRWRNFGLTFISLILFKKLDPANPLVALLWAPSLWSLAGTRVARWRQPVGVLEDES